MQHTLFNRCNFDLTLTLINCIPHKSTQTDSVSAHIEGRPAYFSILGFKRYCTYYYNPVGTIQCSISGLYGKNLALKAVKIKCKFTKGDFFLHNVSSCM